MNNLEMAKDFIGILTKEFTKDTPPEVLDAMSQPAIAHALIAIAEQLAKNKYQVAEEVMDEWYEGLQSGTCHEMAFDLWLEEKL